MDERFGLEELLHRPINTEMLVGLKTRSLRRRVWFRALDRVERGLVDLTIRWVDKVKSDRMARVLLRILVKLARALDNGMARVLQDGRALARGLSELALGWGNELAWSWRFDAEFQWALGLGLLPGS